WPLPSMALLALTLALPAMTMATTVIKEIPLDLALDSFDDRYQGCRLAMMKELPALNCSELQKNHLFHQVWRDGVAMWKFRGSPMSPLSSPDQAIAIMAYTMNGLYKKFNDEVRVSGRSGQTYRNMFHFKTLHFLLTDALATLRAAQQEQKCHCVYRGVKDKLFKAKVGDIVRFGQFTSSSLCKNVADSFGETTVFKVRTCHGADIMNFSSTPTEKEVLIPPFEEFNVTDVIEGNEKVEIHLNSSQTYSTYNCEWLKGEDSLGLWGHP
ncbi:NRT2 ribosyltransferase, partial [Erithacus rubecula]|nr:NRT2 ribosyltransferase [Erithacus rubecula]